MGIGYGLTALATGLAQGAGAAIEGRRAGQAELLKRFVQQRAEAHEEEKAAVQRAEATAGLLARGVVRGPPRGPTLGARTLDPAGGANPLAPGARWLSQPDTPSEDVDLGEGLTYRPDLDPLRVKAQQALGRQDMKNTGDATVATIKEQGATGRATAGNATKVRTAMIGANARVQAAGLGAHARGQSAGRGQRTIAGALAAQEVALRKAFSGESAVKDAATGAAALRALRAAAADGTGASDLSLLYAYMKLLDPNSVVRESEFAQAAKAGSLPQQIQGVASKVINGEKLTPALRAQFLQAADGRARAQQQGVREVQGRYGPYARRAGVDSAMVAYDPIQGALGAPAAAPQDGKAVSAADRAHAQRDPRFAAWLKSQGFDVSGH